MVGITYAELITAKDKFIDLPDELVSHVEIVAKKRRATAGRVSRGNNWRAQKTRPDWLVNNQKNIDDDTKVINEVRGLLNKINEDNYKGTIQSVLKANVTTLKQLTGIITIILYKILLEKFNHELYVDMCKEFMPMYITHEDKDCYFRSIFLERCQHLFKECLHFSSNENKMIKDKQSCTNFINFLGIMYTSGVLTDKIINSCLINMFSSIKKGNKEMIDPLGILIERIRSKIIPDRGLTKNILTSLTDVRKSITEKRYQFRLDDVIKSLTVTNNCTSV